MATNISEWYREVGLYLPGCPQPSMLRAAVDTLRDFCSYTGVWEAMLSPMDAIVMEAASDVAFVSGSPCTITTTTTSFVTAGFTAADVIVTDHVSADDTKKNNSGPYTIATAGVAALALTLESTDRLVSAMANNSTITYSQASVPTSTAIGEIWHDTDDDQYYQAAMIGADEIKDGEWEPTSDSGAVTISKAEYALTSAVGDICKVREAKFNGESLIPVTSETPWNVELTPQPTHYLVDMARKYLRLIPSPSEAINDAIEVWVTLKPLTTATTVQDFIFSEYKEIIAQGIVGRLAMIPNTPWSNPQQAQAAFSLYTQGRNFGWRDGNKGLTKAEFRVRA